MKKFLTLTCVAVLTFGLAATTYAMDWGASGFLRVRSAWYVNADAPSADPTVSDAWDDTNAWMDTRFRLKFTAKANDYASGVIYFEGDSSRWGEAPDGRNTAGAWNADRNAVELKQFYIDLKVPGISDFAPTTVRAGIQGFAVRSHFLLYADGPGVRTETTVGPVKIFLNWFKPEEGADNQADDADIYCAVFSAPGLGVVTPGVYFLYLHAGDYPLRANTPAGVYDTGNFWWLGVFVDGKIGPVALKADFAYFDGEQELGGIPSALVSDPDYSGFGFFADASVFDIIPNATIGAAFAYGTGDDLVDAADPRGNEFDAYRVPPGSEEAFGGNWGIVYYPSAINDGVRMANLGSGTAADLGKLGGTWFGKLYGSFKAPEWLKTTIYAMYIGDTTDEGNTQGDALDIVGAIPGFSSGLEDDSDIGIEIGAYCNMSIYKSLTYSIGAGYLFAGDALDSYTGLTLAGIPINDSPDNPWAVVSQLIYKF